MQESVRPVAERSPLWEGPFRLRLLLYSLVRENNQKKIVYFEVYDVVTPSGVAAIDISLLRVGAPRLRNTATGHVCSISHGVKEPHSSSSSSSVTPLRIWVAEAFGSQCLGNGVSCEFPSFLPSTEILKK